MAIKNIFCLETDAWFKEQSRPWSVEPILTLLRDSHDPTVGYIHRRAATQNEFEYNIKKWLETKEYPILFLSYHGHPESIMLDAQNYTISLDWLEQKIGRQGKNKIIHFASCATLKTHGNKLKWFLKKTKLKAITGYKNYVDWIDATAMDLLVMREYQMWSLTQQGMKAMDKSLSVLAGDLSKHLGFWMVY